LGTLFRNDENTYVVTLLQDRCFDLYKEFDENGENPAFWATLPVPQDVEFPEIYSGNVMTVVETFNPADTAKPRAIVEYEVCDPPEQSTESTIFHHAGHPIQRIDQPHLSGPI